jgi:hypothetical protein
MIIKMNENIQLNFVLTIQEANVILAALQELPAKLANPLTQKLTDQAKPQIAEAEAAAKEAAGYPDVETNV